MQNQNYNFDRDLYELTTMASSLEKYIQDDDVFHNPQGMFSSMPPMTLGTFIMRLRRLSALQSELDVASRTQLSHAVQEFEKVQRDWQEHYKQKLEQELRVRLDSIQTFFGELSDDPEKAVDDYYPELLARTVIEELLIQASDDMSVDANLLDEIHNIDEQWDSISHDSYFHWDERLRPAYPQDNFWWLYREMNTDKELNS